MERGHLLVLIHSPAVGPDTWEGVAAEMRPRDRVVVPSLMKALHAGPPYWKHQAMLARGSLEAVAGGTPVVLAGHSGAGALLPLIAAEIDQPVAGYVFVDAGLPEGDVAWLDTVPDARAAHLRSTVVDGWLPPWSDWWEDADLAEELPNPRQRTRFRAALERLPLAMFEEIRPSTANWPDAPCAYLQLSDGYSIEAAQAQKWGWRTTVLASTHMAPLTDPTTVARHLGDLVEHLD